MAWAHPGEARQVVHRLARSLGGPRNNVLWNGCKGSISPRPIQPPLFQFRFGQSRNSSVTTSSVGLQRIHRPQSKNTFHSTIAALSWPLVNDNDDHHHGRDPPPLLRLQHPLVDKLHGSPLPFWNRIKPPFQWKTPNTIGTIQYLPGMSHRKRRLVDHHPSVLPQRLGQRRYQSSSSSSKDESTVPPVASISSDMPPQLSQIHVDANMEGATSRPNDDNNNDPDTKVDPTIMTITISPSQDDTDPTLLNKSINKRRIIMVPKFGTDATDSILVQQNARVEQARDKTAANVRRALFGNCIICFAKLGAWISSGSSSVMSEFIHSVVDCGNQALLLMGLRDSRNAADKLHPYGYGKSVYFWALVSALGTFFLGAGVSMSHAVHELIEPSLSVISNEVWAVLAMSFIVDGYVLSKTVTEIQGDKPGGVKFWNYVRRIRDPATLAVLLEDGAACLGVVIAIGGIGASYATSNPIFDGLAGVGISCLLGGVGLALVRVNHSFLIGQGVEREILDGIESIIKSRRSIENVSSIQSQWTGPETFSFKAEVDFDGTYLSALLMPRYQAEFHKAREDLDEELEVLLSWYAEDVMRAVEREVRHIEAMIRQKYPGAEYIELEPMSKHADQFAIDDSFEEKLLMIEKEELRKLVRVLYETKEGKTSKSEHPTTQTSSIPNVKVPTDFGADDIGRY